MNKQKAFITFSLTAVESSKRWGIMYFDQKKEEVLKILKSSAKGLSHTEAKRRFDKYGPNELEQGKKVSPLKIFLEQFNSPLVWILIFALFVSIFLKEEVDAIVIALIIIINAALGFFQEFRAEKSIEALQKLASLQAKVLRGGKEKKLNSRDLVPGDIIILETGDKIPADARLIETHNFKTQEGPLTGESQPITKHSKILDKKTVLAERKNMVYAGTVVSAGRATAIIVKTGMQSEIGKIASLIQEAHEKYTPLQKKLRQLGTYLTIAVIIVAIVTFLAGLISGKAATVMLLTAIALAVAAIPEGLPAVITVSLALGVQKMIKKNVLVRKLASVETLGSVNVICTDKTGTLTHNQMTVTHIWTNTTNYEVTGAGYSSHGAFVEETKAGKKKLANPKLLYQILKIGMLCNDAKLGEDSSKEGKREKESNEDNKKKLRELFGDPTEAALIVSAEKAGFSVEELSKEMPRVNEIPFSSERKMMTTFHEVKASKLDGNKVVSYSKGAPDIIIRRCNRILIDGKVKRMDNKTRKAILAQNEVYAKQALRVLGFAYNTTFNKRSKASAEQDMVFVGLQAMIDPPREEVKQSVKECQSAGIKVVMITGDHLTTAQAIAKQLGITGKALTGQELERLSEKDLEKQIDKIGICARVKPEHKLNIVKALQKKGYVVAMTGDGVNDAPALKKADIGVSMGITGTDVAKEAADMILTDDNFTSIVGAVEEGRGIFDNIRKFVNYLLSSNLGEITAIFFAALFGMPLPLTAIQILWINLITDGLPATALSIDPHEKEIMKRKPRPAKESILSKELQGDIFLVGISIGVIVLGLFWLYLEKSSLAKAQTVAFSSFVVFEIARLQMIRSRYHLGFFSNKWLLAAVVASFAVQLISVYSPLRHVFGTVPLEIADWAVIVAAALLLYLINKGYYTIRKLRNRKKDPKGKGKKK